MTRWKVPLADIDLDDSEIAAVTKVLRSKWLSMGPVTAEFEQHFADYVGVTHAFAVTNCTAALHLAHLALGAGPGDTVICPSLTFVATANAIRYTGATPVFADVTSEADLNISPEAIEAKIDGTTKGICIMHYGGYPCDMEHIMAIAKRHNLYVVEDAAHAPGSACWMTVSGHSVLRKCGSIGDIGCFSFFSNKNMTTGEGGLLTTNNDALAEKIRLLRSHGMTSLSWDRHKGHSFSYDVVDLGYNYRFDELRAAIGMVQAQKLEHNNHEREKITNVYKENFRNLTDISLPFAESLGVSACHLFPILLDKRHNREDFMQSMRTQGIQTSIHYPPVHTFSYYHSCDQNSDLSVTNDIAMRVVTLPLYPGMCRAQVDYVIASVQEWSGRNTHL